MKENFKKKVLKNGMTILFEKRDLPVISLSFATRAGGVNENSEEKGISHFIEHMLYKGTPTRNWKEISYEIEKNGGVLNGFTGEKITSFWCKMPNNKLRIALDVLGDMVKNPLFDEGEIEKERKVIFEEIKAHRNVPSRYVLEKFKSVSYEGPFSKPIIGSEKTLNSMDKKILKDKFKDTYSPNNLILCVVGDCDFEELVDFAEKNFGEEKRKVPKQEIKIKKESEIETRKGIDQASLVFTYHVPLLGEKLSFAAKILNALMGEGLSSRLLLEIREKRNLAYSVAGFSEITKEFGHNLIYVGTGKENVEKVKELILEEFEKVAEGLEEKELEEIRTQIIGNYKISMEDSQEQMVNLLESEVNSKAEDYYDFEENIMNVTLDEVKELASTVKEGNYSFFALVPEDE